MKFYKRDPDKALSGMAELNLKQRGGYNSLIDLLYSRDGDVPDDDVRVARMIRCDVREWRSVKAQLMACGKVWSQDGKLHAKRVRSIIDEAILFGEVQRKRATSGWEVRRMDGKSASDINATAMPDRNASTPTATAIEESKKDKRVRAERWHPDAVITSDWFDHALTARRRNALPDIDLRLEAERFCNFWSGKSGANATKLDWHKTWINWILKAEAPRNGKAPTANDKFLAGASEAIRRALGPQDQGSDDGAVCSDIRPFLPS